MRDPYADDVAAIMPTLPTRPAKPPVPHQPSTAEAVPTEPIETVPPRGHKDCDHPSTRYERRKCRGQRLYPPVPSIATLMGRRKSHQDCDHPNTSHAQKLCREGGPQPPRTRETRPPEETKARVLAWVRRQTELSRTGYIGCLPTTADAARALFPLGAIATVGKGGVVTSGGVVHGSKTMAFKYLFLLESEGLVQRHKMTHGTAMMYWSAVDNPTGEPVPPGVLDYYS